MTKKTPQKKQPNHHTSSPPTSNNNNNPNNGTNSNNDEKKMDLIDVICLGSPQFNPTNDDIPLINSLKTKNLSCEFIDWNELVQKFQTDKSFLADFRGLILIRTPWDYTQKYEQMSLFLSEIERLQIHIENPLPLLYKTMNKKYLLKEDSSLIPDPYKLDSIFVEAGTELSDLGNAVLKNFPSADSIVVKPLIGSFGNGVSGIKVSELIGKAFGNSIKGKHLRNYLEQHDVIVQPMMTSLKTNGETSLIFIDGEFSHSVCKIPCQNSITVQGGKINPCTPSGQHMTAAKAVLNRIKNFLGNENPLYVRIDLVYTQDLKDLKVMEVEAFDPELFFRFSKDAVDKIAQALEKKISQKKKQSYY